MHSLQPDFMRMFLHRQLQRGVSLVKADIQGIMELVGGPRLALSCVNLFLLLCRLVQKLLE